jgi:hypothetical protein
LQQIYERFLNAWHGRYIVAGLVERAGHLIYNTAALLGPDGSLVGKYYQLRARVAIMAYHKWSQNQIVISEGTLGNLIAHKMLICWVGELMRILN